MFRSKSDVYKIGWLDIVFANRNKSYGAYELRLHHSQTTLKALFFASSLIISIVGGIFFIKQLNRKVENNTNVLANEVIKITNVVLPSVKKAEEAAPKTKPDKPLKTQKFVQMVVVPREHVIEEPPSTIDLKTAFISTVTTEGEKVANISPISSANGNGGNGVANVPSTGNEIFDIGNLEKYPEFPGGNEAFGRYLSKNLNYPALARENGTMGRVIVSFIVEKNGDLSSIKILRGIGDGCDEEAIRVLKKAPAWKPGEQNGQKVRVAYTVPIFFQLGQ